MCEAGNPGRLSGSSPHSPVQVYQEKEGEEDQPDLFRICQSHEDEVRHLCDIPSAHSVQVLQMVEIKVDT